MPGNKTKVDRLNDLLPNTFNTRVNPNWNGLLQAVGAEDQRIADLVEEVRKQFFVKTASRPYLDRLAANNLISRPKLIGMDDAAFRLYTPILSYQPKQVKNIIDNLLDIFFAKESTTVFMTSTSFEPFTLHDGWELDYLVNNFQNEHIIFNVADFTNITNATASEIASAINRQAKYSFAIAFFDSTTGKTFVRIFTKTIGAKGSLLVEGGRSIIALRLDGFISQAGTGSNTQYTVTKIGDEMTFNWTGGSSPGINFLKNGDIVIINLAGNRGSFLIEHVDIANNKFVFRNLLGTAGIFTQTSANDIKFIRPHKFVISDVINRAVTWEIKSGEIEIEIPATPPIVKRFLAGAAHINGTAGALNTGILGPYMFDLNAPFVLSSLKATILTTIQAGKIIPILNIGTNSIPNTPGSIVFDYGLSNAEGPVHYLYKPNANSLALDPAYTFQHSHNSGTSTITAIRKSGGPILTTDGAQFPTYITDTAIARTTLEDLILSVKSAGIFVNFLIKYPEQLYGAFDVYGSGIVPQ